MIPFENHAEHLSVSPSRYVVGCRYSILALMRAAIETGKI